MIITVWFIRVYIIIILGIVDMHMVYGIYYYEYRTIKRIILENFKKKKNVVHNEYWRIIFFHWCLKKKMNNFYEVK